MSSSSVYRDLAGRTGGNIYIGVVGPVRTGKSTFIKKFMEKLVIPHIDDPYMRERTKDELPQSGSGRTIMTAEPKFIPEEAVCIEPEENLSCCIRLVDCVGYMVNGASGNIEDGGERMVMTPWYDHEIPMSRAAEEGTKRVIGEHSTIGIIVTTDGSICGIARKEYVQAEERAAEELHEIGKPFVMLLNCAEPMAQEARDLASELSKKYRCSCIPVNCTELEEEDIKRIVSEILKGFPIEKYCIRIPEWLEALCEENSLKKELYNCLVDACAAGEVYADRHEITDKLCCSAIISGAEFESSNIGSGYVEIRISMPRKLYYETLSAESGFEINDDRDLISILSSVSSMKNKYERVQDALEEVERTGYGIVMPGFDEMKLEEPQVVRQGGRYGVKLKAGAPSIHMIKTNIETEVSPAIGGERASEDMINFLIQGFDGDMSRIWESNIFGKSLNDIAGEALVGKIKALPEETKAKLQNTIQRIVNEGSGGLICIIL